MSANFEDIKNCNNLANLKQGKFNSIVRDPKSGRSHGEFTCKNNHTFSKSLADVRRNRWCSECAFNAPNTTAGIKLKLSECNITLLSDYVNSSTPLDIQCDTCDNKYEATWENLKKREVVFGCCRRCNISNKKIEEINEKLSEIGFKFNDILYVDAKTKNNYVCENGHETTANWNAIKIREGKCKYCLRDEANKKKAKELEKKKAIALELKQQKKEEMAKKKAEEAEIKKKKKEEAELKKREKNGYTIDFN
jgi:hypothetical protein